VRICRKCPRFRQWLVGYDCDIIPSS
jgi:hypothetical protein